jgi:hypothetical protein
MMQTPHSSLRMKKFLEAGSQISFLKMPVFINWIEPTYRNEICTTTQMIVIQYIKSVNFSRGGNYFHWQENNKGLYVVR